MLFPNAMNTMNLDGLFFPVSIPKRCVGRWDFFFNQGNRTGICHQEDGIGRVSEARRMLYTLGLSELSASHGVFQLEHMSQVYQRVLPN